MAERKSPPGRLAVRVLLPDALVKLFPGAAHQVEFAAATVGEVMAGLDQRWPGMRDRLCDQTPGIRRHIRVFVAGERAELSTRLFPGAEVLIMTAISGG
jgi:molybdopterin converting factor small subunit